MQLAHVALWTADIDAAAAFWQRYFGATVGEPYRSARRVGFVSRFITLPCESARIELMTGPWLSAASSDDNIGWDHIALSLGSEAAVDTLAARCAAHGVLISGPRTTGDGFYEAVIAMPDGTRIEITA